MAGSSQRTDNQEISESIIPDPVEQFVTKLESFLFKNVTRYDKADMLDHLKKLIAGLKEIREFFMKGSDQVKTVIERMHDELTYDLETDNGPDFALRAVQLRAKFDNANGIVYKLKIQELRKCTIPELVDRISTEAAKNLLPNDPRDYNAKTLDDLKEIKEFFMNSEHNSTAGGALVKAFLERILLHELYSIVSNDLETDDGKEVAVPAVQINKATKLYWTVSKLKLQLVPLDSESEDIPTVSKINEAIIPAVVARLELANKYSLEKYQNTGALLQKLRNNLTYIRSLLKKSEDKSNDLGHTLKNFVNALLRHSAFHDLVTDREAEAKQLQVKLRLLNKIVIKLKHQISSQNKLLLTDFDAHWYTQVCRDFDYRKVLDILPVLHLDEKFTNSLAFREFREVYDSLVVTTKMCLLCFAVIPENEVVKKRFMTHWWVAEGFVSPPPEKTYEEAADEIFEELVKKNCIEPVNEKCRFEVDSYKMSLFIRSAVIVLAKEARFFDFDDKGNPTVNFKSSYRACLVDGFSLELMKSKIELDPWKSGLDPIPLTQLDPEKLQVIFNVNEPYPDLLKYVWKFSKFKNLKVLYLGRWRTSSAKHHHIQAESIEFLTGLESMKLLRFLSLQGISRIRELPRSVYKLLNLRILDLRACHDLHALPDGIGSLKNLTHLDISECYLLDYMPKGIANLSELQVLKGFVINDYSYRNSCTLDHLSRLEKLRKLSIYTNANGFPNNEHVVTLLKFKALQKLTITWGLGAFLSKANSSTGAPTTTNKKTQDVGVAQPIAATTKIPQESEDKRVFGILEKLDLKSYPCTTAPRWLRPRILPNLKKLYIEGGNLQSLSRVQEINDKWPEVEVLRLKSLSDLKMDWKKLRSSFPGLIYLENFKCPNLTYFPCNENGVVWLKPYLKL